MNNFMITAPGELEKTRWMIMVNKFKNVDSTHEPWVAYGNSKLEAIRNFHLEFLEFVKRNRLKRIGAEYFIQRDDIGAGYIQLFSARAFLTQNYSTL